MKSLLALLLFVPLTALAESPNMTVEQREFIESYKEAAKSRNEDKYWQLIHPETRACMTENLTRFVQNDFLEKAKYTENINANFVRIEQIDLESLNKKLDKFYRNKAFLPTEPKYTLTAPIRRQANKCGEVNGLLLAEIPIAFHKGQWYEVLPCGKNDLDSFLGKQLEANRTQDRHINDLYDKISPQTWELLTPLLTEDKDKKTALEILNEKENISRSKAISIIDKFCD